MKDELKYHLIINHFIICFNVFGDATIPLLFYKIEKEYWSLIKTFLLFLDRIPEFPKSGIDDLEVDNCLLYTSPSPRDPTKSRMPSSA